MAYRYHEHTADIAFEAHSRTLAGVFRDCARATVRTMAGPPGRIRPQVLRKVELVHEEADLLLMNFLQEFIYYKDAERLFLLPSALAIVQDGGLYRVKAVLKGEVIDPGRHLLGPDVKAVTLHRFRLDQREDGWHAFVVLDV